MQIKPIAYFHSPLTSKFGIPRQSGVVEDLVGEIVFEKEYSSPDAIRGLEGFDYVWLIWGFSANKHASSGLTVRPPRLGGNERLGVFATRSPFRPNPIGLSCVRVASPPALSRREGACPMSGVLRVYGADLMDGTPIYDIKPYVPYADAHPEARGGFTDSNSWQPLEVVIPEEIASAFTAVELSSLRGVLAQDPRPQYHEDPERIYGMPFAGRDVKFRVDGDTLTVTEIV